MLKLIHGGKNGKVIVLPRRKKERPDPFTVEVKELDGEVILQLHRPGQRDADATYGLRPGVALDLATALIECAAHIQGEEE